MRLVSACLLGIKCAWNGKARYKNKKVIELLKNEILIPVCPEQLGGLATPREFQEIEKGSGDDVLDGKIRVKNEIGQDVRRQFIRGAKEALKIARQYNIEVFVAKSRSPSCGCGSIYDGSFSKRLIKGDGVTVALFKRDGIKVITESDI
ncbi:hypothetical protein LCGC14_3108770 [marine sediment metagenome]|uniref:Uncharacterized protein n=1 Tax=marine sediment metagenome TaxID=412755 RepID=A0A0F8YVL4_9ZZZZ